MQACEQGQDWVRERKEWERMQACEQGQDWTHEPE